MTKLGQVFLAPASIGSVEENGVSNTWRHPHKETENIKVNDTVQHEMFLALWVEGRTEVVEKKVE